MQSLCATVQQWLWPMERHGQDDSRAWWLWPMKKHGQDGSRVWWYAPEHRAKSALPGRLHDPPMRAVMSLTFTSIKSSKPLEGPGGARTDENYKGGGGRAEGTPEYETIFFNVG